MPKPKNLTLLRKFFALFVAVAIVIGAARAYELSNPSNAYALGDLQIDWGVPVPGDPIFNVTNMLPGDVEDRDVLVKNNGSLVRPVNVIGTRTGGAGDIESVIDFVVAVDGTDIYGGTTGAKTLTQFFTDSAAPAGLFLLDLNPTQTKTINFKATFDPNAGNNFQNTSVIFDLKISMAFDIPAECIGIEFAGDPIFGTSLGDVINGTAGNDLIFGLEGGDVINGLEGDDCIVGGSQGDTLRGNEGNDVILGSEDGDTLEGGDGKDRLFGQGGGDTLKGGADNDYLIGAESADTLEGENGDDYIEGNAGDDNIFGGEGEDEIYAGAGLDGADGGSGADYIEGNEDGDVLTGGSGNDIIEGNEGDDILMGGTQDDTLIGGADFDTANGNNQTDTCVAEIEISCEL